MKYFICLAVTLALSAVLVESKNGCKESNYRNALQSIADGINGGDAAAVANMFREGGILFIPDGDVLIGKPAIQTYVQGIIDGGATVSNPKVVECEGNSKRGWALLKGTVASDIDSTRVLVVGEEVGYSMILSHAAWGSIASD